MMHIQVHSIGELERVLQLDLEGTMLGINNRDLQTFTVDLDNSKIILSSPAGQEVCTLCNLSMGVCPGIDCSGTALSTQLDMVVRSPTGSWPPSLARICQDRLITACILHSIRHMSWGEGPGKDSPACICGAPAFIPAGRGWGPLVLC